MELKGKCVLAAGMGKSGIAVMEAALRAGAQVILYDKKREREISEEVRNIAVRNAIHCFWGVLPPQEEKIDYVVLSPGIPLTEEIVEYGNRMGAEIIGELELAYRLSKGTYFGITGTNGKTTTTSLVGEILKAAGKHTFVVGNIGTAAVSLAEQSTADTYFAAEISSFQLETIQTFKPKVSALLNITPDHLNRHGTMEGYAAAKARIFKNQDAGDFFVVNRDCPISYKLSETCGAQVFPFSRKEQLLRGCFIKKNHIVIKDGEDKEITLCACDDLQIPGSHNLENALAAAAICYCGGIAPFTIEKGLRAFQGVEHRIEYVDTLEGVAYYNDSKGTNTDAAKKAIDAMEKNIILIAGGYDKGEKFERFIEYFNGRVKHMMVLGQTSEQIMAAADSVGYHSYTKKESLRDCVTAAAEIAVSGDIVLLSPACASWGMYDNFEQRGREFKALVKELRRRQ